MPGGYRSRWRSPSPYSPPRRSRRARPSSHERYLPPLHFARDPLPRRYSSPDGPRRAPSHPFHKPYDPSPPRPYRDNYPRRRARSPSPLPYYRRPSPPTPPRKTRRRREPSPWYKHERDTRRERGRRARSPSRERHRARARTPPRRERARESSVDAQGGWGALGLPPPAVASVPRPTRATDVQLGRPTDGTLDERMRIPGVAAALRGMEEKRRREEEARREEEEARQVEEAREEEVRARRQARDAMELEVEEYAKKWDEREAVCGPDCTAGGHTSTFFGGHAPSCHSWRAEKLLPTAHAPSPPPLKVYGIPLPRRAEPPPVPLPPSAPPVWHKPSLRPTTHRWVRSPEGAFKSGLVGPTTISFSPTPALAPASPAPLPTSQPKRQQPSAHWARGSPLTESLVPPPPPRHSPPRAQSAQQRTVWLGPLPADLRPGELDALLDGYGIVQCALHPAEKGLRLEVEAKSVEVAEELEADARGGMVVLREAAVGVYENAERGEPLGAGGMQSTLEREKPATEGGGVRESQAETAQDAAHALDGGGTDIELSDGEREVRDAPDEQMEAEEARDHAAEQKQWNGGGVAVTCSATAQPALTLRGGASLPLSASSPSPNTSLLTHLATARLPRPAQSTAPVETGSTPPSPSPSPSPSRRAFSPSHAPTPPGRAHYRIHPTRARSPYTRSPARSEEGEDAYKAREKEIEEEMRREVLEALAERREREEWEQRERWERRWEGAEVLDLTGDEEEEEEMQIDA
ncbi:hypothetical protein JCM10450v2_006615 [Rhodotorula kratochvilovae]